MPNTHPYSYEDRADLENQLWRDEGTWFEFLSDAGCNPDYASLMKEARLSLLGHSDYEVTYSEGRAFMIAFIKAYRQWCVEQVAAIENNRAGP